MMCKHSVRNSSCLVIFEVWVDEISLWKKEAGVIIPCYQFLLSLSYSGSSIDHLIIPSSTNSCHYLGFVLYPWLTWLTSLCSRPLRSMVVNIKPFGRRQYEHSYWKICSPCSVSQIKQLKFLIMIGLCHWRFGLMSQKTCSSKSQDNWLLKNFFFLNYTLKRLLSPAIAKPLSQPPGVLSLDVEVTADGLASLPFPGYLPLYCYNCVTI